MASSKHQGTPITDLLRAAEEVIEHSTSDTSFYDTIITNDELDSAFNALEAFIYGITEIETNGVHGDSGTKDTDITMAEEEANGTEEPSIEEAADAVQADAAANGT